MIGRAASKPSNAELSRRLERQVNAALEERLIEFVRRRLAANSTRLSSGA